MHGQTASDTPGTLKYQQFWMTMQLLACMVTCMVRVVICMVVYSELRIGAGWRSAHRLGLGHVRPTAGSACVRYRRSCAVIAIGLPGSPSIPDPPPGSSFTTAEGPACAAEAARTASDQSSMPSSGCLSPPLRVSTITHGIPLVCLGYAYGGVSVGVPGPALSLIHI